MFHPAITKAHASIILASVNGLAITPKTISFYRSDHAMKSTNDPEIAGATAKATATITATRTAYATPSSLRPKNPCDGPPVNR